MADTETAKAPAASAKPKFGLARAVYLFLQTNVGKALIAGLALVVLFAALFLMETASPPANPPITAEEIHAAEDPPLARVEEALIYLSDVERAARLRGELSPGEIFGLEDARVDRLLQELIDRRVMASRADALGLAIDQEVQQRLDAAREQIMASVYLERIVEDRVSPENLRAVYEQQSALVVLGDEVRARHILVGSRTEAETLISRIQSGAPFEDLARRFSRDRATGPLGGEVGYFTAEMMAPEFSRAAFSTAVGDIAEPFQTEYGWHILQVEDRRPAPAPSFEVLEPEIRRYLILDSINEEAATLRAGASVEIFDRSLPSEEIVPLDAEEAIELPVDGADEAQPQAEAASTSAASPEPQAEQTAASDQHEESVESAAATDAEDPPQVNAEDAPSEAPNEDPTEQTDEEPADNAALDPERAPVPRQKSN